MAFFPCSNHHAPYKGPSSAAYAALVTGGSSERRHLRMCGPCMRDYVLNVEDLLSEVDYTAVEVTEDVSPRRCSFCANADPEIRIFVNAYEKGADERAFWGHACTNCQPRASAEVLLS